MSNEHMERYSASLVIKENDIKNNEISLHTLQTANNKISDNTCRKECGVTRMHMYTSGTSLPLPGEVQNRDTS